MNVAVLGSGVTGNAVHSAIDRIDWVTESSIELADLIVVSPGIPKSQFPNTDIPCISEIEFAYRLMTDPRSSYNPRVIGVTGTNGKTTVTSLISHIAQIPALGNIGVPFIEWVEHQKTDPVVVVELSSFQLETVDTFKCDIAVMLNLRPDHLARHKTVDEYYRCKARICQNQSDQDTVIVNEADPEARRRVDMSPARKVLVSDVIPAPFSLDQHPVLIGAHNRENASAAIAVCREIGIPDTVISQRLETFPGVPHRLELVAEKEGCRIFNDSKATNPEATLTALQAIDAPIHLILCGEDKQVPLDSLILGIKRSVRSVTVFGELGKVFRPVADELPSCAFVESMSEALYRAYRESGVGEVVLLSPSSSSYDMYKNFEERGDHFRALVEELTHG